MIVEPGVPTSVLSIFAIGVTTIFLSTFAEWIYNKKVDKYDKIEDRKRRNKKCLQKIRNTPRNISKQ